jgi:peptidoglycan/LPS O-acetylase OafA/YrhL
VWPVYLVTMHLAAAWIIFTRNVGHVPSPAVDQLTATSYLRQLLLVQLWFEPYFDGTSWDGPAWSISAEWLAYLLFGVLVMVVFRIARVTRARGLMWLAFAASLPPTLLLLATGEFYTPWSWLPRIVMQFTAGALACAAVRKLRLTDRTRRGFGWLSLMITATIVGGLYYLDANPPASVRDASGLVDVLFVPLVVALAVGAGTLPRLLSTRLMVYCGHISFGLYMVHELVHTAWNWAAVQFELTLTPGFGGTSVLIGLFGVAGVGAIALYHGVEEPARLWMRRMVDVRDSTRSTVGHGSATSAAPARESEADHLPARVG